MITEEKISVIQNKTHSLWRHLTSISIQVVDLGHTVKKTKIDESSVLLQKIEKLRESRRMMKTEIRNAKAEIQELKEQMTLLNEKVDSMSKKRTCNRKNNVMEQLDIIKNILIDMKK